MGAHHTKPGNCPTPFECPYDGTSDAGLSGRLFKRTEDALNTAYEHRPTAFHFAILALILAIIFVWYFVVWRVHRLEGEVQGLKRGANTSAGGEVVEKKRRGCGGGYSDRV